MRSSSAANMSISSSSNGLMEDECGTVKQFECHEHGGSVSESENQYNTSNHKGTNILILNELDIKKIVSNNDYSSISKKDFIGEMSSSNSRKINRENDLLVRRLSCSSQNSAQASVRSISDNNNKPTLFANPAFNRFFNPPTTLNSLQPTIFYKQKDDKMQTTQYNYNYNHNQNHHNNTNNYYYNNKVQGSLNSHINNQNKVEFEEDAAVSVAATKLKEYLDFEENNNNNNNSSIIQANPIREFSRFFNNKSIHNSNTNNRIVVVDNRNYNSRRSNYNNNNYYYSATESLGESDQESLFESSSVLSSSSNINKKNYNLYNQQPTKKIINGYHLYFNNTTNRLTETNRIKQLKNFQEIHNKNLQEIHNKNLEEINKVLPSKTTTTNNNNNNNNKPTTAAAVILNSNIDSNDLEDKANSTRRISYTTTFNLQLRQPLKDINYFSDTEGIKLKSASTNSSNRNRYKHSLVKSKNNTNSTSDLVNNLNNKPEQLNRTLSSSVVVSNRNINNKIINSNNTNNSSNLSRRNSEIENNSQVVDSFTRFYQPSAIVSKPTMVSMASSSYMNKPQQQSPQTSAQSFSKLGPANSNSNRQAGFVTQPSYNFNTTAQAYQKWTPSTPMVPYTPQQQQQPRFAPTVSQYPSSLYSNQYQEEMQTLYDDEYEHHFQPREEIQPVRVDPVQERYERELGMTLAKPSSSKPNYSDSFFYNSTKFNYPTIDDQKKLAKTIACSLEGSDPSSAKFISKKKQFNKDGYESETLQSPGFENQNDYASTYHPDEFADQSYAYDDSLPDVIKRSIAQANMYDPIRMVHAPENFKQQHYTEHVSHTQMPPKAALTLAHELEDIKKGGMSGGRGAALFQKRKARSEKWIVENQPQHSPYQDQQYQRETPRQQQPLTPQPEPEPKISLANHYTLPTNQPSSLLSSRFTNNYNAKPRGWGNFGNSDRDSKQSINYSNQSQNNYEQQQSHENESYASSLQQAESTTPVSYESNQNSWSQQNSQQQQQQAAYDLKPKVNTQQQSLSYNQQQQQQQYEMSQQQSQVSKVKLNKLSSHENYLFNNRNAVQMLNTNQNLNSSNQYSDLNEKNFSSEVIRVQHLSDNPNFYHYDESIASSDL